MQTQIETDSTQNQLEIENKITTNISALSVRCKIITVLFLLFFSDKASQREYIGFKMGTINSLMFSWHFLQYQFFTSKKYFSI